MSRTRASLLVLLFAIGAAAALAPELGRYKAKIELARSERALLATTRLDPERQRQVLPAVRDALGFVAGRLPFDVRPLYLLGTSALLLGEPGEAIEQLRRALSVEERPETDLNLSRAHSDAGDPEAAAQDALRAVWLSPALLRELPEPARAPVADQIAALEKDLASGSASAIPALAPSDAPAREDHR
jgi:tetratricopeptide (TPR) repeat protein